MTKRTAWQFDESLPLPHSTNKAFAILGLTRGARQEDSLVKFTRKGRSREVDATRAHLSFST